MATQYPPKSSFEHGLRNHFLIAMPGLQDPHFAHSVLYICEHGPEGAMGFVINRTLDLTLGTVFDQMDIRYSAKAGSTQVLAGGPVGTQRGFVLHSGGEHWHSSVAVGDGIFLTASRDILTAIASDEGPANPQFVLGYAGWGAGQLEDELMQNSWLTVPADAAILFDTPVEQRWQATAKMLGVDIRLMPSQAGHA